MRPDSPPSPVRVFMVEDQPTILKSQLKLLQGVPELKIVGTALSGEAALEEIPKVSPEVVLLDLGLPRMSGIEVTRALKERLPDIEVLIFTVFDEEDNVLGAVQAGASGYLLKGVPQERMVEAILEVRAGGAVIQPNLARRLLRHFRVPQEEGSSPRGQPAAMTGAPPPVTGPAAEAARPEPGRVRPLSDREQEILQLIAKGVSNTEAAALLNVSRATIRTHLEHIYRKLEVTNRVEAVTEGIRKGLISV